MRLVNSMSRIWICLKNGRPSWRTEASELRMKSSAPLIFKPFTLPTLSFCIFYYPGRGKLCECVCAQSGWTRNKLNLRLPILLYCSVFIPLVRPCINALLIGTGKCGETNRRTDHVCERQKVLKHLLNPYRIIAERNIAHSASSFVVSNYGRAFQRVEKPFEGSVRVWLRIYVHTCRVFGVLNT